MVHLVGKCVYVFQKAIDTAIEGGLAQDDDEVWLVRSVNRLGCKLRVGNLLLSPGGSSLSQCAVRAYGAQDLSLIFTAIGPRRTGAGRRPRAPRAA